MTQAGTISEAKPKTSAIKTPIDGLIVAVANLVGGSKAKEVERFLKFASVGTLGAIIDLGTSNVLMATLLSPIGERGNINVAIAATISFIAAVMSNFFWNRYWTYPDSRSRPLMQQLGQFGLVSLSGWTGRTIWILLAKDPLSSFVVNVLNRVAPNMGLSEQTIGQLGASLAILMGIFVVMIWNFFVNRYWTYNDVD